MTPAFQRSLPPHPDLPQQRKQAKELLRGFRSGDAEARARVRAVLPDKARITLADAQHVLACEYGFTGWAALKQHIEGAATETASPMERLRDAIRNGDARALRRLLERHAELRAAINDPLFPFDAPALVHCASTDEVAVIDVLLAFGADPNQRSAWWAGGFHPLHCASARVAERLLAAGALPDACAAAHLDRADLLSPMLEADPRRVAERGGDGQTPLHFASSRRVVDLLLEAGADPDARDVDHRSTPAQWMLDRRRGAGRYELAGYLVERGATADVFLAAALGLTERIRTMLQDDASLLDLETTRGAYAEQPPSSFHIYMWTIGPNLSPLGVAAQFEQIETLDMMRGFASPKRRFLAASSRGDAAEARLLLGAHPGLLESLDPGDQRILPDAGWAGDRRAVELMLDLGFDPSTPGQDSGTVLHCAAWQGAAECVAVILRHPNGRSLVSHVEPTHGSTPLGWCCHGSPYCASPSGDYPRVARLLLDAGALPGPNVDDATAEVRAVIEGRAGAP